MAAACHGFGPHGTSRGGDDPDRRSGATMLGAGMEPSVGGGGRFSRLPACTDAALGAP
jgi:hypothetical protein